MISWARSRRHTVHQNGRRLPCRPSHLMRLLQTNLHAPFARAVGTTHYLSHLFNQQAAACGLGDRVQAMAAMLALMRFASVSDEEFSAFLQGGRSYERWSERNPTIVCLS